MKTYSLKRDLGLRKETLQRNFDSNDRGPEHDEVKALLKRPGNFYTASELLSLSVFFLTPHDECVDDFSEDYRPLEVYTARRKIARVEGAMQVLDRILQKDKVL